MKNDTIQTDSIVSLYSSSSPLSVMSSSLVDFDDKDMAFHGLALMLLRSNVIMPSQHLRLPRGSGKTNVIKSFISWMEDSDFESCHIVVRFPTSEKAMSFNNDIQSALSLSFVDHSSTSSFCRVYELKNGIKLTICDSDEDLEFLDSCSLVVSDDIDPESDSFTTEFNHLYVYTPADDSNLTPCICKQFNKGVSLSADFLRDTQNHLRTVLGVVCKLSITPGYEEEFDSIFRLLERALSTIKKPDSELVQRAKTFEELTEKLLQSALKHYKLICDGMVKQTEEVGRLAIKEHERFNKLDNDQEDAKRLLESMMNDLHEAPHMQFNKTVKTLQPVITKSGTVSVPYLHRTSPAPILKEHFPRLQESMSKLWPKGPHKNPNKVNIDIVIRGLGTVIKDAQQVFEIYEAEGYLLPAWFRKYYAPWLQLQAAEKPAYIPTDEERKEDAADLEANETHRRKLNVKAKIDEIEKKQEEENKTEPQPRPVVAAQDEPCASCSQ